MVCERELVQGPAPFAPLGADKPTVLQTLMHERYAESEFDTPFKEKLTKRVESITKKQREELADDDL